MSLATMNPADALAVLSAAGNRQAQERPVAIAERGLTADGYGIVSQVIKGDVVQHIHVSGCWGECGVKVPRNVVPILLKSESPRAIRTAPLAPCAAAKRDA